VSSAVMEGRGNPPLKATEVVSKRRRSVASRKPRSTEQLTSEYNGILCGQSHSSSHDDDAGIEASGHRRKELYLNSPEIRGSTPRRSDVSRKLRKEDRGGGDHDGHARGSKSKDASKRGSGGVLALECTTRNSESPDNPLLIPRDGNVPGENRTRKVKLKVKLKEAVDGGTHATSDGTSHRLNHKVCSMPLLQGETV
jgi:hypothetical protein